MLSESELPLFFFLRFVAFLRLACLFVFLVTTPGHDYIGHN